MNELRALIVDDSKTACVVMARLLRANGIESDSCYSGQEALSYLQSFKPAVIFMDHNMPGMDGFEVVKALKESPDTATIPVMMYTARSGEDVFFGQARALGAIDVLPKQLDQKHIQQALTQLGMMPKQRRAEDQVQAQNYTQEPSQEAAVFQLDKNIDDASSAPDDSLVAEVQNAATSSHAAQINEAELGQLIQDNFQKIYINSIRGFISEQIYSSVSEFLEHYKSEQRQFNQKIAKNLASKEKQHKETVNKAQQETASQWNTFREQQAASISSSRMVNYLFMTFIGFVLWMLYTTQQDMHRELNTAKSLLEETSLQLAQSVELNREIVERAQPQSELSRHAENRVEHELDAYSSQSIEHTENRQQDAKQIIGYDTSIGGYIVQNSFGYNAYYSTDGELLSYVPVEYYLDSSCFGEPRIVSEAAFVYRDYNDVLWRVTDSQYTEKQLPMSMRDQDGSCKIYQSEQLLQLNTLELNDRETTGIELSPVKISISSY
jgi:CheY-like chemotaxis protein